MSKNTETKTLFSELIKLNPKSGTIIDLGSASGELSGYFKEKAELHSEDAHIITFDGSFGQLKNCNKNERSHASIHGYAPSLPFGNNCADIVVSSGFIDFFDFDEMKELLEEKKRIAKAKGYIAFTYKPQKGEKPFENFRDAFAYTAEQIVEALGENLTIHGHKNFQAIELKGGELLIDNAYIIAQMPSADYE